MIDKIFKAAVAVISLAYSHSAAKENIRFNQAAEGFFRGSEAGSLWVYSVSPKPFSPIELERIKKILDATRHETKWGSGSNSQLLFTSPKAERWVKIDTIKGEISYFDDSLPGFEPEDTHFPESLEAKADNLLQGLIGNDAKQFELTHHEDDWVVGRDTKPQLANRTYRYVRKIDGRRIEGTVAQARITLGSRGFPKRVEVRNLTCPPETGQFTQPSLIQTRPGCNSRE